uniref:GTP-binding protein 10-like n=1 Tax=Styela clava TaxID=7725 RepID=UPI00193946A5|nr:GTP-binding protein 10-like [Styela clava]
MVYSIFIPIQFNFKMVRFTTILFTSVRRYSPTFIDSLRIYVRGGTGGAGLMHLGGIGGRGGDVFIVGTPDSEFSLKDLKNKFPEKRFSADAGEPSSRRSLSGWNGRSIFIQVPQGITIFDADTGKKIGIVNKAGDRLLVARGGKGGDRFNRFQSRKGESRKLVLDLRLIADVGFVGFPNAGKSTLMNAISKATPTIADYPFTTLRPHIGIMEYPDFRRISCADLPGLIEGAHINLGMGHKFLKHIERTKLLLFVVDVFGFSLYTNHNLRDAFENVQLLTKELELYNKKLISRPAILIFNKMDMEGANDKLEIALEKLSSWENYVDSLPEDMIPNRQMNFSSILSISAKQGTSLYELKDSIRQAIDEIVTPKLRLTGDENNKELEKLHERSLETNLVRNVIV